MWLNIVALDGRKVLTAKKKIAQITIEYFYNFIKNNLLTNWILKLYGSTDSKTLFN